MDCTHTSLRRASRQLTQLYDEALAPSGLTTAQAQLVSQIDMLGRGEGVAPSLQSLARRLGIQMSALTHALKPLTRDGLVAVHGDETDRRIKRATLTEKGMERTQAMYGLWRAFAARMDAVLGDGASTQLRLMANRVASPEFRDELRRAASKD